VRFGFVTDELSQDPRQAIETALAWGVDRFEIRNVRGVRFPRHEDDTCTLLARLCEEYPIRYTAVSPGFFKCPLSDTEHIRYALGEGLDRTLNFMAECQVPLLILFGFEKGSGSTDEAVSLLQRMADRLAEHGFDGAVENETHCLFDVPENIATLLRRVNRTNLGANWDPGNLKEYAPGAFPEGYAEVRHFVFNVHAKDVALLPDGSTAWKAIGEGVVDWPRQLRALQQDGIVEHITIESHLGPPEEVGRRNLETLRSYLEQG
jgi:sugar phosphate isomerase/epimerase